MLATRFEGNKFDPGTALDRNRVEQSLSFNFFSNPEDHGNFSYVAAGMDVLLSIIIPAFKARSKRRYIA